MLIQTYDTSAGINATALLSRRAQVPGHLPDALRLYKLYLTHYDVSPVALFGNANGLARWLAYPSSARNAPWCMRLGWVAGRHDL